MTDEPANTNAPPWSDRLCRLFRQMAEDGAREREIIARCREIISRNIQPPADVKIAIKNDHLVVEWQGREVARAWSENGRNRRRFEDGPWTTAIEELSESLPAADEPPATVGRPKRSATKKAAKKKGSAK